MGRFVPRPVHIKRLRQHIYTSSLTQYTSNVEHRQVNADIEWNSPCSASCRVAQGDEAVRKAEQDRALAAQHTAVAETKVAELQRALENAEERARSAQRPTSRGRISTPLSGNSGQTPTGGVSYRCSFFPCPLSMRIYHAPAPRCMLSSTTRGEG